MVNLTMTAALEWGPANVRVNAVAPGLIFSSGVDKYPVEFQERLTRYAEEVPLGRTGTEAETSSAIVFLLSEGAAFISGATINIDGACAMATPHYKLPARKSASPVYDGFHLSIPPKLASRRRTAAE
jgi:citronellol/citronellal dehydrogenase